MTLVQSSKHGRTGGKGWGSRGGRARRSVRSCKPCCTGCANETASGPRRLTGRGQDRQDQIREPHLGHGALLRIITPPFAQVL